MNNEYTIINKTAILKKIEDLESKIKYAEQEPLKGNVYGIEDWENEIKILNGILSQSTHLILELSKAYDAGKLDRELSLSFDNPKSRYLNSLKLKI
jgi:wobble nucleotide-excising tRNase